MASPASRPRLESKYKLHYREHQRSTTKQGSIYYNCAPTTSQRQVVGQIESFPKCPSPCCGRYCGCSEAHADQHIIQTLTRRRFLRQRTRLMRGLQLI